VQVDAALIRERGVTFAVVVVRPTVMSDGSRDRVIEQFRPAWGGVPVVLMAQDGRGVPTFYGRPDLVRFLKDTPVVAMPWKRWNLN